jgi:flagellar hook protein FlgE
MTTALTGLQAAETTIDVTGNNVANSNTVGFKESDVLFATQFLRTISIGSAPTENLGGTNPRQIGLGVKVSEIRTDFTQGTIEISANPLDVAIQGEGFLVVQGASGTFYTRAGQLSTNAENQIITPTGHRVLGYGVDDEFNIDESQPVALTIPLGEAAVAQATENAYLSGALSPESDVATMAEIIESQVLGDASFEVPDPTGAFTLGDLGELTPPSGVSAIQPTDSGAGTIEAGSYRYKIVFADPTIGSGPDEGPPSVQTLEVTVGANRQIDVANIPVPSAEFTHVRIYRNGVGDPNTFRLINEQVSPGAPFTFTDNTDDATWQTGAVLDTTAVDGASYSYYVTFVDTTNGLESRPTQQVGSQAISGVDRRILIEDIPQPDADATNGNWNQIRIYRNVANDSTAFYEVATIPVGQDRYIDSRADADIILGGNLIDLDGPKLNSGSFVSDMSIRDGANYSTPFENGGTLSFSGYRDGRRLAAKELTIVPDTTTVQQLIDFMREAMGIHTSSSVPSEPLPGGAGVSISNGVIEVISNMGIENALSISLTSFSFRETGASTTTNVGINFSSVQDADGQGATAEVLVYDSLGIPLSMQVTTVVEEKTGDSTTIRWYAYSPDNEPLNGVDVAIGNGLITFNNEGELLDSDQQTVAIDRTQTASASPLEINLDFSQVSGLAQRNALDDPVNALNFRRQDGFPPGVLTSFLITEGGLIRGVFSNGTERALGQILLARFANSGGLQAVGDNMFQIGVNSGEAIIGRPGENGIATLLGGAVELSNTDIGQNLIELILASTQYRGNARVITTAQELLDELLALRR